jgi:hypothetical protein
MEENALTTSIAVRKNNSGQQILSRRSLLLKKSSHKKSKINLFQMTSTIILFGLIVACFVTTISLVVTNAQSSEAQFNELRTSQAQTEQELQRAEVELNELRMSTLPTNVTLVQNGTLWMFVSNLGAFSVSNPFATAMNYTQSTYSFYQVSVAGGVAVFNVLQIDPPPSPLVVTQSVTYESGGYYSFQITMQLLDPPVSQLTSTGTSAALQYALSDNNIAQMKIYPDCTVSGNCVQTNNANQFNGNVNWAPADNSVIIYYDYLAQPNSGVIGFYYLSTTNSPSYDFQGSTWTLNEPWKLILPVL